MTATSDSKPYGVIYCIENKVNGKRYVGQTTMKLAYRWKRHCSIDGRCLSIAGAIKKYGPEGFSIKEIDSATSREELDAKEIWHIQRLRTLELEFGYNLRAGGMSASFLPETRRLMSLRKLGGKLSEEHKAKIAAAGLGRRVPASVGAKISAAKKGVKFSEEHKRNMSIVRMGWKMSDAHKLAVGQAATGAFFSEERRRKISEALTGKKRGPLSEEVKAKLSMAFKGKQRSEEDRQKMRDGRAAAKLARQQALAVQI